MTIHGIHRARTRIVRIPEVSVKYDNIKRGCSVKLTFNDNDGSTGYANGLRYEKSAHNHAP